MRWQKFVISIIYAINTPGLSVMPLRRQPLTGTGEDWAVSLHISKQHKMFLMHKSLEKDFKVHSKNCLVIFNSVLGQKETNPIWLVSINRILKCWVVQI